MASPTIKVKRSAVSGKIPTTAQMDLGELAVNTFDGKVYIEQDQSSVGVGTTVIVINPWSVGTGTNTYNTYFTAGNVGVGSTLPTSKLDVVGDGKFTGVVTATSFSGPITGAVTGNVTGNINASGVSTITFLQASTINASGIITALAFSGPITGNLSGNINASGVSTSAFLQATTINVSAAATIPTLLGTTATFTNITANGGFVGNLNASGVSTSAFLQATTVNVSAAATIPTLSGTTATFTNITANGGYTGNINSSGVSTVTYLRATNVNATGLVTATTFYGNIYSTGISTISGFKFPSSDGTSGQFLKTDGFGNLSFATASGGSAVAAGSATSISDDYFTATQGQTVFTATQNFTGKSVQVFLNGVKLRTTSDFTTTTPSTVTLVNGATAGDRVNVVVSFGYTLEEQTFTATQGQLIINPSGSFASPSNIKVYVNGIKLRKTTDYGASSSVALVTAANNGDEIDLVCDNAEDYYTASQGQTLFTPTSTDITSSNLQVFLNGVRLENTQDYTVGSPAINLVSALTAGDEVDVVITRT